MHLLVIINVKYFKKRLCSYLVNFLCYGKSRKSGIVMQCPDILGQCIKMIILILYFFTHWSVLLPMKNCPHLTTWPKTTVRMMVREWMGGCEKEHGWCARIMVSHLRTFSDHSRHDGFVDLWDPLVARREPGCSYSHVAEAMEDVNDTVVSRGTSEASRAMIPFLRCTSYDNGSGGDRGTWWVVWRFTC